VCGGGLIGLRSFGIFAVSSKIKPTPFCVTPTASAISSCVWHALDHVELAKGGAGRKGGVSEYARQIGRPRKTVEEWVSAAEVVKNMADIRHVFDKTYHLSAIHSAPEPLWPGARRKSFIP